MSRIKPGGGTVWRAGAVGSVREPEGWRVGDCAQDKRDAGSAHCSRHGGLKEGFAHHVSAQPALGTAKATGCPDDVGQDRHC